MGHLTKCEWGSVPGCLSDSKGCLAVGVQEYATAQDMMQSTCIREGYARTIGNNEINDGEGHLYLVQKFSNGMMPLKNYLGATMIETHKAIWLSDYGNDQIAFESAINNASFDRPLIIDTNATLTKTINVNKDIKVIGLCPIYLTPFEASANQTAKYYFTFNEANRISFENVHAFSSAKYTPGINILNNDNSGVASNVFLCEVINVKEACFINCEIENASLVRQGTGNKAANNSLFIYNCRGKNTENFINAVNGSVHIYNCDIECSSATQTSAGYSEFYHGIYIGAVFFDSEVIGCNFTVSGPSRVSSALHFNDSSGDNHDVNIFCSNCTIIGYQTGGSFNFGNVILSDIILPNGPIGGSLASVATVNTNCSLNGIVSMNAGEGNQYRFIQNNTPVNIKINNCNIDGISTGFATTNGTSGSNIEIYSSNFRTYKANTGSVSTMGINMSAYNSVFENFANFTTTQPINFVYSNCTLIPHMSTGQTYFNISSGSSLLFTGLIMDSGQITLQGEGTKNIDCIQHLYSGVFNKFSTMG